MGVKQIVFFFEKKKCEQIRTKNLRANENFLQVAQSERRLAKLTAQLRSTTEKFK